MRHVPPLREEVEKARRKTSARRRNRCVRGDDYSEKSICFVCQPKTGKDTFVRTRGGGLQETCSQKRGEACLSWGIVRRLRPYAGRRKMTRERRSRNSQRRPCNWDQGSMVRGLSTLINVRVRCPPGEPTAGLNGDGFHGPCMNAAVSQWWKPGRWNCAVTDERVFCVFGMGAM